MGLFKSNNTYSVEMWCRNCGAINDNVRIKKGITIKEALEENLVACAYCGCSTLQLYKGGDEDE